MTATYIHTSVFLLIGCVVTGAVLAQDQAPMQDLGARIIDKVYGDILLQDKNLGLVIAVKKVNGKVISVQVDNYKNAVNLRLDMRGGGRPPQVTYSRGTSEPPIVWWTDLNADGVFDRRIALGRWQYWDQGAFAFLDGKWVGFRPIQPRAPGDDGPEDQPEGLLEGKPYRFDLIAGKWEPLAAGPAAPATRPAR